MILQADFTELTECHTVVIKSPLFTESKTCLNKRKAENYARGYIAKAIKRSSSTSADFVTTIRPATPDEVGELAAKGRRGRR